MEYERIDKPQTGIISPSKLRMKLMGVNSPKKKDSSSNGTHSSRTSPSKLADTEFIKNGLLASANDDVDFGDHQVAGLYTSSAKSYNQTVPASSTQNDPNCVPANERGDSNRAKVQHHKYSSRGEGISSSAVHPAKALDEENLDYDSNASSSSFEFHKGEKSVHKSLTRSFSRPTSYKWNDAERWIKSKQSSQAYCSKTQINVHSEGNNCMPMMNVVRVVPEAAFALDNRLPPRMVDTKRVDFCQQPATNMGFERFSFAHHGAAHDSDSLKSNGRADVLIDLYPQSTDLEEIGHPNNSSDVGAGTAAIRAVSMRDMGTEMTPGASLEPSRTATPVGSSTPFRSPTSSLPSTPRRGELSTPPGEHTVGYVTNNSTEDGMKELSEEEMKQKTRREIVALGVQLGKMNIAAWASKDDKQNNTSVAHGTGSEEPEHMEYEKRAAAWEEAEKSKHAARYKREEIKIQAWERHQKAKLEAEMRRIEAQVEQMRAQAHAKMVKKVETARRISEAKRAAAEARKNHDAERTAAQAEYIRQTGRIPSSSHYTSCCGLFA